MIATVETVDGRHYEVAFELEGLTESGYVRYVGYAPITRDEFASMTPDCMPGNSEIEMFFAEPDDG